MHACLVDSFTLLPLVPTAPGPSSRCGLPSGWSENPAYQRINQVSEQIWCSLRFSYYVSICPHIVPFIGGTVRLCVHIILFLFPGTLWWRSCLNRTMKKRVWPLWYLMLWWRYRKPCLSVVFNSCYSLKGPECFTVSHPGDINRVTPHFFLTFCFVCLMLHQRPSSSGCCPNSSSFITASESCDRKGLEPLWDERTSISFKVWHM